MSRNWLGHRFWGGKSASRINCLRIKEYQSSFGAVMSLCPFPAEVN